MKKPKLVPELVHIKELIPDAKNLRAHNPRNIGMIADSLQEVGAARSIVIDEHNNILAGNGTVDAAAQAGIHKLKVIDADGETIIAVRRTGLTPRQKKRLAAFDNRTAELATWDAPALASLLAEDNKALEGMFNADELLELLQVPEPLNESESVLKLSERFGVPPFSILDSRQGYWQDLKRAWLALGIKSEIGRGSQSGTSARSADGDIPTYRQIGNAATRQRGNAATRQ